MTDPWGSMSGSFQLGRVGGWSGDAAGCRVSVRGDAPLGGWGRSLGWRLLRTE